MPIIHAIVLGLVQGLAEFLPISSSGHLLLVPWLFGWDDFGGDPGLEKAFDVALHIGTLVAVVAYFRRDLVVYVRDGLRMVIHRKRPSTPEGRLAWLLVVSALPAAVVGALLSDWIDEQLGTPFIIAISLIGFGLLLGWVDSRSTGHRRLADYQLRDSLAIGAAQVLSLNPGTSRSGITITASRHFGFDRDTAARISFLMAIPVTAGAIVYEMISLAKDGIPDGFIPPMIVGIVTSGVAGWFAVWGTITWVRSRTFAPFVIYRCALGGLVLLLMATGVR
jgi:undecaprenyl-diphosphatase